MRLSALARAKFACGRFSLNDEHCARWAAQYFLYEGGKPAFRRRYELCAMDFRRHAGLPGGSAGGVPGTGFRSRRPRFNHAPEHFTASSYRTSRSRKRCSACALRTRPVVWGGRLVRRPGNPLSTPCRHPSWEKMLVCRDERLEHERPSHAVRKSNCSHVHRTGRSAAGVAISIRLSPVFVMWTE